MWIISKSGEEVYNSNHIIDVYIGKKYNTGIVINVQSGKDLTVAEYQNLDFCKIAISMFIRALKANALVFQFPKDNELEHLPALKERATNGKKNSKARWVIRNRS